MKKALLFTLAGVMLFAFTQCGGGNSSKDSADNANKEGTQPFKDVKAIYDETEKAINDAKTCEDLEEATKNMFLGTASLAEKEYAKDEKATEAEKEELRKQLDKLTEAMETKESEFGCNKD